MDSKTPLKNRNRKPIFFKYTLWLLVGWSIIIAGLLFRDMSILKQSTRKLAIREAQAHFQKDEAFRFWASTHGGFYVPASERTAANPYLSHISERDIETPSGVKLTLMNPAYALRQLMEEFSETYGIAGHITSLKPLRPENKADEWEAKSLRSFETGNLKTTEFTNWNNELSLRLMQPLVTQKGCLKCHEHQGYSVGDIRGGVSVTLPMKPYLEEQNKASLTHIFSYLFLWFIGIGSILTGSSVINKNIHKRDLAQKELEESHHLLEKRVIERTRNLSKSNQDLQLEIHVRKQVEEALRLSEQQYKAVYQNVPVGFQSLNPEGIIIDCNPAWLSILGYQKEEVIGKWFGDFLINEHQDLFAKNFKIFRKNKRIENVQFDMCKKDGSIIKVSYNGNSTYSPEGTFIKSFCTFKDITDEVDVKKTLIKTKEKAEESDRLKSAFLANMSHEIRTPMNGILGFADLLKEPNLTGEQQQKYVSVIEHSGERMLNIINDLIDISKIEAGQMEVSFSNTNIKDQADYLCTFFKPEMETKGLKLITNFQIKNTPVIFRTDREKLYAIITNLLKNAIKYTKAGTIEFGYRFYREPTHPTLQLQFYVKDTGIGIPTNRLEAVFERFIQADIEDKNAMEGAGLGLAITKAYLGMMGGEIWVESEENVGSTFYFTIPDQTQREQIPMPEKTKAELKEKTKTRQLKILIAEDDENSRMHLSIILDQNASKILYAQNGVQAVELCRSNPDIDLIMMDIKMPVMNGNTATRKIRESNKDVIIIAQTAYALAGDREKALEAGCNDYISKPIIRSTLIEILDRHAIKS